MTEDTAYPGDYDPEDDDPESGARGGLTDAFTMVELMVVVAIITLAAGLMTPTITDFFRNRRLESIRGQFGSAFNLARLEAVRLRSRVSLVFFREGVRVFNERDGQFSQDDHFNPETSPIAADDVWYVLGFLNNKPSTSLPRYRAWESMAMRRAQLSAGAAGSSRAASRSSTATGSSPQRLSVADLPRVTFERDGTLHTTTGADVSTTGFLEDPPREADLYIYQAHNTTVCFVDFRNTGQMRSKSVPLESIPPRPPETSVEAEAALAAGAVKPPEERAAGGEALQDEAGAFGGAEEESPPIEEAPQEEGAGGEPALEGSDSEDGQSGEE